MYIYIFNNFYHLSTIVTSQVLSEDLPKLKEMLAKEEFEVSKKQKGASPKIINYHDEVKARTHHLRGSPDRLDASKAEEDMLQCTIANKLVLLILLCFSF